MERLGDSYPSHHRNEKEEQAFPMTGHVRLWKLDSDGEHADSQDNPSELQSNSVGHVLVVICPPMRINNTGSIRTCIMAVEVRGTDAARKVERALPMMTPNRNAQQASPM